MKKRICSITTVSGTLEDFVIPAMRKFVDRGYDVTLISSMSTEFINKYSAEFHCINVPMKRGISILDCLKMPFVFCRLFIKGKYDIVQYATPNASFYASLGAILANIQKRVYCQWGIRYVGSEGLMRRILKCLEKITCLCSTHIRPASRKNMEFAIEEGLYQIRKAAVIGDGGTVGVDLKEYDIELIPQNRKQVYKEYPFLENAVVFGFVGRLTPDKGINELLVAFKKLKDQYENIALILIGDIDQCDFLNHHFDYECTNIVITGWRDDVPKYLSVLDVLVHPSYREGFSMVIQQAMAMSLPVVTTNISGPSEVILNNVTGKLAEPRDAESLYKMMKWMLDHPEERKQMGQAGRKRCEMLFNRERMVNLTVVDRDNILNS